MSEIGRLVAVWLGLLAAIGIEAAAGYVLGWGLVSLAIGLCMAGAVALFFMEAGRGPSQIRVFAVAGVFWLLVLLGLGVMDPLTRHDVLLRDTPAAR